MQAPTRWTSSTFIASQVDPILHDWEAAAKAVAPPHALTRAALRDHWGDILKAIGEEMGRPPLATPVAPGSPDASPLQAAASKHGARRQQENFEVDELVAEFRAMRSTVLKAWQRFEQSAGRTLAVDDANRFSEALDRALAGSIDRHLKDRARVRDLFLAMLGHDLRAPLSGIQMAAHVIDHPAADDAGRARAAVRIRRALVQMAHLITDLIDFTRSRLGAGMPITKARCDLAALAHDALEAVRSSFPEREFQSELSGDLSIDADAARMSQLLRTSCTTRSSMATRRRRSPCGPPATRAASRCRFTTGACRFPRRRCPCSSNRWCRRPRRRAAPDRARARAWVWVSSS